jgi:autotransporter passenger strand-loop-strand repeat protein
MSPGGGGTLIVLSGGTASGTIDSGGLDVVLGTANGTTIDSGGIEVVVDGGAAISAELPTLQERSCFKAMFARRLPMSEPRS